MLYFLDCTINISFHDLTSLTVEAHPFLLQEELVAFCKPHKIHMTAYMPFGGDSSFSKGGETVLKSPVVLEIAQKLGKDVGQVLASWGIKVRIKIYFFISRVTFFDTLSCNNC